MTNGTNEWAVDWKHADLHASAHPEDPIAPVSEPDAETEDEDEEDETEAEEDEDEGQE